MKMIEKIMPFTFDVGGIKKTKCHVKFSDGSESIGRSECKSDVFDELSQNNAAFSNAIGVENSTIPDAAYEDERVILLTIKTKISKAHIGIDRPYAKELSIALRAAADSVDISNENESELKTENSVIKFHSI